MASAKLWWNEIIDALDKLHSKGLSHIHVQCLRKFAVLQGQIITDAKKLRGTRGGIKIPADETVSRPYYLHNLVRGVYKPQNDIFALSIQTNPASKWGKEIEDPETGKWKINYDFEDEKKYVADMKSLQYCHSKNIPIGVIYKKKKAHNQILGLGIIKKIKGTLFEISPYSIEKKSVENKAYTLIKKQYQRKDYISTGSERTVIGRMNNRYFKEELMKQYNSKCAMCNFSLKNYLIGAHIVPVNIMRKIDPKNAMNPANGLLLCQNCDIAYELGDITVDPDFTINISKKIWNQARNNRSIKSWLENIESKIYIKKRTVHIPRKEFLKKKVSLVKAKSEFQFTTW